MSDPTATTTVTVTPTPTPAPAVHPSIFSQFVSVFDTAIEGVENFGLAIGGGVKSFLHSIPGQAAITTLEVGTVAALEGFLPSVLPAAQASVATIVPAGEMQKFLIGLTGVMGTALEEFLKRLPHTDAPPVTPPAPATK